MKSLIAEDDVTSRLILERFLSQYGECDVVADGKEAVQGFNDALRSHRGYDLVCMDLGLPVMDGQTAIREIHGLEAAAGVLKTVRIIVTTGHTDMESITNALIGKCNGYLMKPIDKGKLRERLLELGLIG
jgi:two-component system, chemotaxis family, chemotaxis protein CheY